MTMRVQIAGVSSLEEAMAAADAGCDALGFTVRLPTGVHDALTEAKARELVEAALRADPENGKALQLQALAADTPAGR